MTKPANVTPTFGHISQEVAVFSDWILRISMKENETPVDLTGMTFELNIRKRGKVTPNDIIITFSNSDAEIMVVPALGEIKINVNSDYLSNSLGQGVYQVFLTVDDGVNKSLILLIELTII